VIGPSLAIPLNLRSQRPIGMLTVTYAHCLGNQWEAVWVSETDVTLDLLGQFPGELDLGFRAEPFKICEIRRALSASGISSAYPNPRLGTDGNRHHNRPT
jgi:hypothetical protein